MHRSRVSSGLEYVNNGHRLVAYNIPELESPFDPVCALGGTIPCLDVRLGQWLIREF